MLYLGNSICLDSGDLWKHLYTHYLHNVYVTMSVAFCLPVLFTREPHLSLVAGLNIIPWYSSPLSTLSHWFCTELGRILHTLCLLELTDPLMSCMKPRGFLAGKVLGFFLDHYCSFSVYFCHCWKEQSLDSMPCQATWRHPLDTNWKLGSLS